MDVDLHMKGRIGNAAAAQSKPLKRRGKGSTARNASTAKTVEVYLAAMVLGNKVVYVESTND